MRETNLHALDKQAQPAIETVWGPHLTLHGPCRRRGLTGPVAGGGGTAQADPQALTLQGQHLTPGQCWGPRGAWQPWECHPEMRERLILSFGLPAAGLIGS